MSDDRFLPPFQPDDIKQLRKRQREILSDVPSFLLDKMHYSIGRLHRPDLGREESGLVEAELRSRVGSLLDNIESGLLSKGHEAESRRRMSEWMREALNRVERHAMDDGSYLYEELARRESKLSASAEFNDYDTKKYADLLILVAVLVLADLAADDGYCDPRVAVFRTAAAPVSAEEPA